MLQTAAAGRLVLLVSYSRDSLLVLTYVQVTHQIHTYIYAAYIFAYIYIHTYINFLMCSRISGWQAAAEAAALRLNAKIVGICIMYVCLYVCI